MAEFDRGFWEEHWSEAGPRDVPVHPHLPAQLEGLTPGTALDAGCGTGAEVRWLASRGWQTTGVDISEAAIARAEEQSEALELTGSASFIAADLMSWRPSEPFDLVVTAYAHAEAGQTALYHRLTEFTAPGGTLLIIGHLHGHGDHPVDATASLAQITGLLRPPEWTVEAARTETRTPRSDDHPVQLHDVIVRARRAG